MKQRDDNYHIKIKPEILFNVYKKFKSAYVPWVYAYLKLDYNNYIFNSPNRFYKIDRKPICEFFNVDPATISRAFSELIENGLMEKRNQEYKVLNDLDNTSFANKDGYPEFIQINNNFFMDFIQRLNAKNENKDRSLIKAVEVFYYLITKNRHVMVDSLVLSSGETAKSINKNLHHDGNYIKNYLELLETVGQIEIDEEGKIKTVYGCGTCQPIKKNNVYDINRFSKFSEEKEINQDDIKSIPEDCESDLIPTDEGEESKPEHITDREKIDLILMISEGDKEQTERLLKQYKISDESLKAYSESCNSN